MSKLLRRLAAPMIALGIAAGMFTHVEAASAANAAADPKFTYLLTTTETYRVAHITNCDGRREQFMRGIDGDLYHRWQTAPGLDPTKDSTYSNWVDMRVWMLWDPSVARNTDCRLDVFWIDPSHEMVHMWQDAGASGGWSGTENFRGWLSSSPWNEYFPDGRIIAGAWGSDNTKHFMRQTAPSQGPWIGWY
ncbi:hypothetical protein [Actinoplanes sp. NPDC026619]|uniref:hypothetical protein n=1 Tax=Actinoplanes sp. NPDC026619 TaxID=3155798 RepID=UPI0033CDB083